VKRSRKRKRTTRCRHVQSCSQGFGSALKQLMNAPRKDKRTSRGQKKSSTSLQNREGRRTNQGRGKKDKKRKPLMIKDTDIQRAPSTSVGKLGGSIGPSTRGTRPVETFERGKNHVPDWTLFADCLTTEPK
jgi:hypothetical protein